MSYGGDMPRVFGAEALDLLASRFKVLAEPMRLRILQSLRQREKTVTELVEELETGQANVSKHLGLLHRNGLVERRKKGLNVYYRIEDPGIFQLCEAVCDTMEADLEAKVRRIKDEG
jgi:DNA-binding transcriptional ArsR family regulator